MSKIILFSQPQPNIMSMLEAEVFNKDLKGKKFAYLPCDATHPKNAEYTPFWQGKVESQGGIFQFIDNSKTFEKSATERSNVESADYLFVPGGNTFTLLRNLKRSGLDETFKRFFQRKNVVYCGMSAGAIILSPTINFASDHGFSFGYDENEVGLSDLSALNIINFEPLVHFDKDNDKDALKKYSETSSNDLKTICNDEYMILTI